MSRIPEITSRDALPEESRPIFDAIAASRGHVQGPFAVLLHSPEATERIAHLGTYLRFETGLPTADLELAVLAGAREWDCEFEWSAHGSLARKAGVREEAIQVIAHRRPLDQLTADEALIVRYVQELLRNRRVSAETFAAARSRYGDKGITNLTAAIGYYGLLACVLDAFEVEPLPGTPRLP